MRIDENLASLIKNEPKSKASRQAKRLSLRYVGFGRYAGRDGKVAYIVDKNTGELVPYKSAEEHQKLFNQYGDVYYSAQDARNDGDMETASKLEPKIKELGRKLKGVEKTRNQRRREDKKETFFKTKEERRIDKALKDFYNKRMFSDEELQAIEDYIGYLYDDMNSYLYKGHEPGEYNNKDLSSFLHKSMINLDQAFDGAEAPFDFPVYTGLGPSIAPENLKAGQKYLFRGYLSTSVTHINPLDAFAWEHEPKGKNKNYRQVLLQIDIKKGDQGIYIDGLGNLSGGEREFLLPRGTMIEVISGPHTFDRNILARQNWESWDNSDVVLFHCKLVPNKEE